MFYIHLTVPKTNFELILPVSIAYSAKALYNFSKLVTMSTDCVVTITKQSITTLTPLTDMGKTQF